MLVSSWLHGGSILRGFLRTRNEIAPRRHHLRRTQGRLTEGSRLLFPTLHLRAQAAEPPNGRAVLRVERISIKAYPTHPPLVLTQACPNMATPCFRTFRSFLEPSVSIHKRTCFCSFVQAAGRVDMGGHDPQPERGHAKRLGLGTKSGPKKMPGALTPNKYSRRTLLESSKRPRDLFQPCN